VLLHLVDATLDDVGEAYAIVRGEVSAYGAGVAEKPEIVALSKADAVPKDEMKKKARALKKVAGTTPLIVSAASGEGVTEVLRALASEVRELRAQGKEDAAQTGALPRSWRP
jgi:GTP-binding protein